MVLVEILIWSCRKLPRRHLPTSTEETRVFCSKRRSRAVRPTLLPSVVPLICGTRLRKATRMELLLLVLMPLTKIEEPVYCCWDGCSVSASSGSALCHSDVTFVFFPGFLSVFGSCLSRQYRKIGNWKKKKFSFFFSCKKKTCPQVLAKC